MPVSLSGCCWYLLFRKQNSCSALPVVFNLIFLVLLTDFRVCDTTQAKSSEIDFDYEAYASQRLDEFNRLMREARVSEAS